MARIDPARLDDIHAVLDRIRGWPGVEERATATFYLNRRPFLHFHAGADSRRADVKGADGWTQVDLPEPCPASVAGRLRRILEEEYRRRTVSPATP